MDGNIRRFALAVGATSFGFSLVQLDVSIVNIALPRIGSDMGIHMSHLQWVVDAYALALASCMLSGGYLSDRFGARPVYLAGILVFGLASGMCGLAGSVMQLTLARAIQGVGAAIMLPSSLVLLNAATAHDRKLRALAVGYWTAISSVSIAVGPIVGAFVMSLGSWRWIFFINLPLCLIAGVMALYVSGPPEGVKRGFNLVGQMSIALAQLFVIGSLIESRAAGLGGFYLVGALILGLVCLGVYVISERASASPLIPADVWRLGFFRACLLYGVVANFTYYGIIFIISFYLQDVLKMTPTVAGYAYIPLTLTFLFSNVLSGALVSRFGSRWPMVGGALVDGVGFLLLSQLSANATFLSLVLPFMLVPGGMGVGVPAMTTAVLENVPAHHAGVASGALNAARQAAGALGIAVFGAFSGEGADGVLQGLHRSALLAVLLLLVAAAVAHRRVLIPVSRA